MNKAITIQNLSKKFILPQEKRDTLKERFLKIGRSREHKTFHAVDSVSIDINKGEFVGIIGKNGSGKSTLLKIVAGIYKATDGDVNVSGRIAPFLELGIGFQEELTARENIFVNGTLLGLTRPQIRQKFNDIVDFAEIRPFLDMKVKNFSSGMRARLAFAIAK